MKKEGRGKIPETPFPAGLFLSWFDKNGDRIHVADEEVDEVLELGYQKVVGELLWAQRNCYPDIAQGVIQLCKVMSRPSLVAWSAALHMVHYCMGQKERGIRFNSNGSEKLLCYYDSSNKGDHTDEKAQYGWVVMFMGGPLSWESKKHRHVGKSSSHNEYMSMSQAAVEVKWIRELLEEMGFPQYVREPTPLLGDNDQATRWGLEHMVTGGTKPIRVEYHFVKECVELVDVDPRRVPTEDNISDIFTKALSEPLIERFRGVLTGYEQVPEPPPPMPS